ncbi:MAG: hypothetical protein ONB31_07205 [candidate division KSB1 bacterium]|nr:hypothetical protein [candidate division KSB1 bacterium]MDZ7335820.1 hypothetical protein [candidate division KSB1 bacterium]MDZ7356185.1 hypothetical protein [candidate division KSB1 bacterium]MDZ7400328.1 hypothetical protein [candidate division KSB1 bacterium]
MVTNSKKIALLLGIILIAGARSIHAEDGILAGAFMRMGLGARANAMGNAFTGVAEGSVAAYYNPAGIPFLESRQLSLEYRLLSLDRKFNYVGFATGIRPKVDAASGEQPLNAGIAISWIHAGVDHIDGRDFEGNHYQDFSNAENAFALSFGIMPIRNKLAIGLTGKVLYNRIPDIGDNNAAISDFGMGVDVGLLAKPWTFLSIGILAKDINAKYDWKTDKVWEKDIDKTDRFPTTIRLGIGLRYPYPWLLFAFDLEKNDQQNLKYFIGTEAVFQNKFAGRVGLNNGSPTFGAGYQFELFKRAVQIQYAFVSKKYDVAPEHIFSWVFNL